MSNETKKRGRPARGKVAIFLDSFSGNAGLLTKSKCCKASVLAALMKDGKISTFDFSEKIWLWHTVQELIKDGSIEEIASPYPWHRYRIVARESATNLLNTEE